MSGFSPDWLRLREPADHRARDRGLSGRLARYLAERAELNLVDLGCGTGSNLRALAPILPAKQSWRLVDYDPSLLDAARSEIEIWQRQAALPDLALSFEAADLRADLERLLTPDCDLVTAAALFDLVSPEWLERFVALLAARRRAFYTVLIYDGAMRWRPAHPLDEKIRAAFNDHQRWDKGFGASAGPDAASFLAGQLRAAHYEVAAAPSPWLLTRDDLALITATAQGIAQAARETGQVSDPEILDWLTSRQHIDACEIGHVDILALPKP